MARKIQELTLDNKKVEVYELRVKDVMQLFEELGDDPSKKAIPPEASVKEELSVKAKIEKYLPLATNLQLDAMMEYAPSELKEVYDAFMQVNTVFLEVAKELGLLTALGALKRAAIEDFQKLYVSSSSQDMEQMS